MSVGKLLDYHRMKHCSYCGRAGDSEAVYCTECGTKFIGKPESPAERPIDLIEKHSPPSQAPVSEQPWTHQDAWKCLGLFVVFGFVIGVTWEALRVEFPGLLSLSRSGAGHFTFSVTAAWPGRQNVGVSDD